LANVSGSGFVVSKNAHVVTNNHVVGDCVGDIRGNLPGQAPVKLRVVSADETNDLALLQGPKKFKEKDIATIRTSAINSGDQVVAIGYPLHGLLTSDLTVTTGIISSLAGMRNDTRYLQISAQFSRAIAADRYTTRAAMLSAWSRQSSTRSKSSRRQAIFRKISISPSRPAHCATSSTTAPSLTQRPTAAKR
jgi:S1-C subfamily serine protease